MAQSPESAAGLHRRPQTGLLYRRTIHGSGGGFRAELSRTFLRTSFQRAALPAPYVLPVRYEDHARTDAADQRLVCLVPGFHRPAGDARHGRRDALSGGRGADGAHSERFGPRARRAANGNGDRRHGGRCGAAGPLLRPLGRAESGRQRRYPSRPGRDAHRRQVPYDAHALRSGYAATERGDGFPLRTPFDRPLGLPPLVRGARGAAALLQPCLQSGDLPRRPRRNAQAPRSLGPEHELAGGLFALERHQPGVDRNVSQ